MKRLTGSILTLFLALVSFAQLGTLEGVLSDEESGEKKHLHPNFHGRTAHI